jgi:hypothetical protein
MLLPLLLCVLAWLTVPTNFYPFFCISVLLSLTPEFIFNKLHSFPYRLPATFASNVYYVRQGLKTLHKLIRTQTKRSFAGLFIAGYLATCLTYHVLSYGASNLELLDLQMFDFSLLLYFRSYFSSLLFI